MRQEKTLAAIMFADIVGYTSLMQKDEELAVEYRNTFKRTMLHEVQNYRGDIIQFYGDGCLAIFKSGIEAVQCGQEIQKALFGKYSIPARIGLHAGDITIDKDGAYGDSVNLAARIESFAIPGSVLFSEKILDEIKNQSNISFKAMGSFKLKNVKSPLQIFALDHAKIMVPDPNQLKGKGTKQNSDKTIAVLAFENLSNDPEQDYFAHGISEEIINVLAKLPGLKVAGRTSAFSFKNQSIDLREVGNQLNVQTVLEGSVRKAGSRVRITAQLINVQDGFHLWSERYDRELEDIFAIQDDISERIARQMKLTLLDGKNNRIKTQHTKSIDAFQWYLRGRQFLDQRAHMDKAIQCFRKALECDAEYALAYSGLAYSYFYQIVFGYARPRETFLKASEAVNIALRLDPEEVEGHLMKGIVSFYYEHNIRKAMSWYKKAEELAPNYYDTYRIVAYFYSMVGETKKAIEYANKAFELDPLNINAKLSLAEILYRCRHFDKSIKLLNEINLQFPNYGPAYIILSNCLFKQGKHDQASENFEKGKSIHHVSNYYKFSKAIFLAQHGEMKELLEEIDTREKESTSWQSPVPIASLYFAAGNLLEARKWMHQASEEKDPLLMMVNCDPIWDQYKLDPPIQNLLKKIGII